MFSYIYIYADEFGAGLTKSETRPLARPAQMGLNVGLLKQPDPLSFLSKLCSLMNLYIRYTIIDDTIQ